MASLVSEGDFQGDSSPISQISFSPCQSVFPVEKHCVSAIVFDGFLLSKGFYGSLSVFTVFSTNCFLQPPWPNIYLYPQFFSFSNPLHFLFLFRVRLLTLGSGIRKSLQELDLGIDDSPVALPPQFFARAATANRSSLVVTTVNSRKKNLRALMGYLPRVWGFAESCVGRILGPGRVQFLFQSEESLNLVLRCGPWSFNEWMLTVHRWYPNISENDMKFIPFWVQIRGTPLLYLFADMDSSVGNQLGLVSTVDFDENATMVEFVRVKIDWIIVDCVMGLWLHQFGLCGVGMSRLHVGLVNYRQQDLRNALAMYRWETIDTSESETWGGMVTLYEYVEETYKDEVFQNDLGTEVLVPMYQHFRIRSRHIGLHATFCEKEFSLKLLHTKRNKEKSYMKLDNNGSSGRLASKATLRKASSNSLLLYFLLVYGTYICVCNNCVSIILYVFVITLLD